MVKLLNLASRFQYLTKYSFDHSLLLKALHTGDKDTWLVAMDQLLEAGIIDEVPIDYFTLDNFVRILGEKILHKTFYRRSCLDYLSKKGD